MARQRSGPVHVCLILCTYFLSSQIHHHPTMETKPSVPRPSLWIACVIQAILMIAGVGMAWMVGASLWGMHPTWGGVAAAFLLAFGYGASRGSRVNLLFVLVLVATILYRGTDAFAALIQNGSAWRGMESIVALSAIPTAYLALRALVRPSGQTRETSFSLGE